MQASSVGVVEKRLSLCPTTHTGHEPERRKEPPHGSPKAEAQHAHGASWFSGFMGL